MTDAELVEFASEFREGILDGKPSARFCFMVVAPLAALLSLYGVEAKVVESDLGWCNHFWLRLPDGRTLDPTADQFGELGLPPVYLGPPVPGIHPPCPPSSR